MAPRKGSKNASRTHKSSKAKKAKAVAYREFNPKYVIGIDNGVTGSWCVLPMAHSELIQPRRDDFWRIPTVDTQNYQVEAKRLQRANFDEIVKRLKPYVLLDEAVAVIERPMINPARYEATLSAVRCFEATLIALEYLQIAYRFVDSREWQSAILPGIKGANNLKEAGRDWCRDRYPELAYQFDEALPAKHHPDDGDAVMMAHWARNMWAGEVIVANQNGNGWTIPRR